MQTTLDILPETEPTTIGHAAYEGFWASSVTWGEVVEDDRNAGNPINYRDPSGLDSTKTTVDGPFWIVPNASDSSVDAFGKPLDHVGAYWLVTEITKHTNKFKRICSYTTAFFLSGFGYEVSPYVEMKQYYVADKGTLSSEADVKDFANFRRDNPEWAALLVAQSLLDSGIARVMQAIHDNAGVTYYGLLMGAVTPGLGNTINHIFGKAQHNLGGLVSQFGSEESAFGAMQTATESVIQQKGITSGLFEEVVTVGGQQVTVRGAIVNGAVRIATAFK